MGGLGDAPAGDRPPRLRTGRLEAFSDGVFAIAITLLALDLAVPVSRQSEQHLLRALAEEWPGYLGYVVSFSTIGALWIGHSLVTESLERTSATMLRLNLLLLLIVSFLPFPTRLLSEYVTKGEAERVAATVYGIVLLAASAMLSLLWRYARDARLIRPDLNDEAITLLTRRLTPSLGAYGLLIVVGLFVPVAAVVGYLAIALYLLIPFRFRPGRRRREPEAAPSA